MSHMYELCWDPPGRGERLFTCVGDGNGGGRTMRIGRIVCVLKKL